MSKIIFKENLELVDKLNNLLKRVNSKQLIMIEDLDTSEIFGVKIVIPSILEDQKNPFELTIAEEISNSGFTKSQIIDIINYDVNDFLTNIIPDFEKIIRIKEAFVVKENAKYDNTKELSIEYKQLEKY